MINENVLNREQIKNIKVCGKFLAETLEIVVKHVKVGTNTKELDEIAESELRKRGCVPAFLNYYVPGCGTYPASLCVSINDEIVHGIPSTKRIIEDGDVISLDFGAEYKGVFTDMATTVIAGKASKEDLHLLKITQESLEKGIAAIKLNGRIGDIGHAVETYVLNNGLEVIRDYVGHGIGTKPHMWPQIPNFGHAGTGPKIIEGMALAVEPMVLNGDETTEVLDDNWTVVTASGTNAAHFEHTIIIENGKPVVVTRP